VPRFKLTIEYAGTRYSGWQIQANARTVQGEIARAVGAATGRDRFELYGSGRTDAGVHALGQVAHLDIATSLPPLTLCERINDHLPADIVVLSAEKVSYRFHARHDAVARRYVYQIARRRMAFGKPFVWWVRDPLDLEAMRDAARRLTGMQDFRSFTEDDPGEKSTKVLVDRLDVVEAGPFVLIVVEGSHFLWKLVRRLVGVLAAVGRGELAPADVDRLLRGKGGGSTPAQLTAPASGLFLARVFYEGDDRNVPVAAMLNV
jgi:tRNA pseudouridine38-40 synthase